MGLFSALRGFLAGAAGGEGPDSSASAPYGRALTRLPPAATLSHDEGRGEQTGKADGVDWDEVRRVYEEGEVPLKAIQARFKVSRRAVRQRSLEEGWRLRPQIAKPGPRQGQRRHNPKSLTRRLLRVAGERLARLEEAAAGEAAARPATADELKAMAELARALAPLLREDRLGGGAGPTEVSAAERAAAAGQAGPVKRVIDYTLPWSERQLTPEERAADVAWMRAELKKRIAILRTNYQWHKEQGRGEEFLAQLSEWQRAFVAEESHGGAAAEGSSPRATQGNCIGE